MRSTIQFQSTHPVWGGTQNEFALSLPFQISIHPPRVGWDILPDHIGIDFLISIHPPRGGWDLQEADTLTQADISIHPPRGGWDIFFTYPR